jgi:alginate production protein
VIVLAVLVVGALAFQEREHAPTVLRAGHWLEVRGRLEGERFVASRAELVAPERYELLIGTVPGDSVESDRFRLLGQPVHVSPRTDWEDGLSLGRIAGRRIEVEGRWRGPGKLSAREVSIRGPGRERLGGRVDVVRPVEGGLEVELMRYTVFLPGDLVVECEEDPLTIALAEPREVTAYEGSAGEDLYAEDDLFGEGIALGPFRLEGQLEWKSTLERELDLDETDDEDRDDHVASARARVLWDAGAGWNAVLEGKFRRRWRSDDEDGRSTLDDAELGEAYLAWHDALGVEGLELTAGRQDFDEHREWIYDQDLDAVKLALRRPGFELELSGSTTLADGDRRDEESTNLMAYLSNGSRDRHLAAWSVYRDIDVPGEHERNLHLGARALGEWLPETRLWVDSAVLVGERTEDVRAFGYDIGATWSPDFAEPVSLTLGYAFGSGDADPTSGDDGNFRQTGFQDNNGRFAGVTSFRYYGELVDPELSNLGVVTVGLGARLAERTSIDVVYHDYLQDEAAPLLVDSDLDAVPSGLDADLGRELDVVLGWRELSDWDLEIVAAFFEPGDAFPGMDDAFLFEVQLRYRF